MSLGFMKYAGSKKRFVNIINKEVVKLKNDVDTYVEPFLGSGAVFLNLPFEFKDCVLTDIDRNVIQIWKIFDHDFKELKKFYENVILRHGNPGREKEVYYKTRDELNERYFKADTKEESFYLFHLSRNCMNSMLRFGKRGLNSAWGNRGYDLGIGEADFNMIKGKVNKAHLFDINFFDLHENFNDKNILMFLDPPYGDMIMLYNAEAFNKREFLSVIKRSMSKIIFTYVHDEVIDRELGWRVVKIRDMVSINPRGKDNPGKGKAGATGTITKEEVMYCNF